MPATGSIRVRQAGRFPLGTWQPPITLSLLVAVMAADQSLAADAPRTTTIPSLEFRLVDVDPDAPPLRSFEYCFDLYSSELQEPLSRPYVAYRSDDGILRIPRPYPPFGRIRVWVRADDLQNRYRLGYGSFSYLIDAGQTAEPVTIQLEHGVLVTGKVLDAETGKPIPGAHVAPLKYGHHTSWPDWNASVKTDCRGRFRLTTLRARGISVIHSEYAGSGFDDTPYEFSAGRNKRNEHALDRQQEQPEVDAGGYVFRLSPFLKLRGRVVDVDGEPIGDVLAYSGLRGRSDADGRFSVKVTRKWWGQREDIDIEFFSLTHRTRDVPLKDFSFDRETVVTLERLPLIQGQILDESGRPLKDCTVEVRPESEWARFDFRSVSGPDGQGRWEMPFDEGDEAFTIRVSVAGSVRSLRRYTPEDVTRGPIVTRLDEGHRIAGKLVANVRLDEKSTPLVVLRDTSSDYPGQQARVQADGSFAFRGLPDGAYTLQLRPAINSRRRAESMQGVMVYSHMGVTSPNKLWERTVSIADNDVDVGAINLHEAGLLPGRVTGVACDPRAANRPFANAFGYICIANDDFDTVGGSYYLMQFMTDAKGRFRIDACPPGEYVVRLNNYPDGYGSSAPAVWIRVVSEETIDLPLFAPEAERRLAIDFVVGDGSSRDVHAGAALDAALVAKHTNPRTGRVKYIEDPGKRLRAKPSLLLCRLQPLDETVTHWPVEEERFEFSPHELLNNTKSKAVIANVSPGRWRLTLRVVYDGVGTVRETLATRDIELTREMMPLQIALPPAALSGRFSASDGGRVYATITAVPQDSGQPTRECGGDRAFRFIALAPGTYTLRLQADGCETKLVEDVVVRKGETTWLEGVVLKRIASKTTGP